MKRNACQVIIWLSFEWSRKALKCLQVTGLKVELQEWGPGRRGRKILGKEGGARRLRKRENPRSETGTLGTRQSEGRPLVAHANV